MNFPARRNVLTPDEHVMTDNTVYNAHLNAVGESYIRLPADTLLPGQYTISVGATQALRASIPMYLRVSTDCLEYCVKSLWDIFEPRGFLES
jgi:hypothetical protein